MYSVLPVFVTGCGVEGGCIDCSCQQCHQGVLLGLFSSYSFYTSTTTRAGDSGPGGQKEMSSILAEQYSALVYEPKCGGGGFRGLSQWVQLWTWAQIEFGDLTPYLTYEKRQTYVYVEKNTESIWPSSLLHPTAQTRPRIVYFFKWTCRSIDKGW
jgi:hypothetical protein